MYAQPHYADSAFAIIGRALEYVTGMPYEDYVAKEIFQPLGADNEDQGHLCNAHAFTPVGMSNSFFDLSWADSRRVPDGYAGNASVFSTVAHADLHWASPTGQVRVAFDLKSPVIPILGTDLFLCPRFCEDSLPLPCWSLGRDSEQAGTLFKHPPRNAASVFHQRRWGIVLFFSLLISLYFVLSSFSLSLSLLSLVLFFSLPLLFLFSSLCWRLEIFSSIFRSSRIQAASLTS